MNEEKIIGAAAEECRVDYICDTILREQENQWQQLGEEGRTDVHLWCCDLQMMKERLKNSCRLKWSKKKTPRNSVP